MLKHAKGKFPELNPLKPWDIIFREAAADDACWSEHANKNATPRCSAHDAQPSHGSRFWVSGRIGKRNPIRHTCCEEEEHGDSAAVGPPSGPATSKKGNKRRSKGGTGNSGQQPPWLAPPSVSATLVGPQRTRPAKMTITGQGNNAKLPDGRFARDTDGVNLCWEFNRKANGCASPYPNKRSHRCEWCRDLHRAIGAECSVKPRGWQP